MALDYSCLAVSRFDNVGIDGALRKEADIAELCGLLLKDSYKLLADDFPLSFGVGNTFYLAEETLGSIDSYKLEISLAESSFPGIASERRAAQTDESTPPERASSTFLPLVCSLIS